jgi:hypothetical protein
MLGHMPEVPATCYLGGIGGGLEFKARPGKLSKTLCQKENTNKSLAVWLKW